MKSLKSIFIAFTLLLGFNSFAQEVNNPTIEIAFKGNVWYMPETSVLSSDWMKNDESMLKMMALELYESDSKELGFSVFQSDQITSKTMILAVPFLSCGIGHEYYQLIQTADNFLLFESVARNKYELEKNVIVFNKRR